MSVVLLRSRVRMKVTEVGDCPDRVNSIAVLVAEDGNTLRIPVTIEEARMLGSLLNETVSFRLAIEPIRGEGS